MRDRVNVPIDPKLKELFEKLKEIHGKTWTEILEKGALEAIMESNPVSALEYEIKLGDEEQEERRQALIMARQNIEVLQEKKPVSVDSALLKYRDEMFLKDERSLRIQWPNQINWTRIMEKYQFAKKGEAVAFIRGKLIPG